MACGSARGREGGREGDGGSTAVLFDNEVVVAAREHPIDGGCWHKLPILINNSPDAEAPTIVGRALEVLATARSYQIHRERPLPSVHRQRVRQANTKIAVTSSPQFQRACTYEMHRVDICFASQGG